MDLGQDNDQDLRARIAELAERRRETVALTPPKLISLGEKNLLARARMIGLPSPDRPQGSILIPVFNPARLTFECLASIATQAQETCYVVIEGQVWAESDLDHVTKLRLNGTTIQSPAGRRAWAPATCAITRGWARALERGVEAVLVPRSAACAAALAQIESGAGRRWAVQIVPDGLRARLAPKRPGSRRMGTGRGLAG